ncbi:hypothetical protein R3P38DRAFT_549269 [Favolaschia claudopus]|uniref:Uncharacterized protein n=1 Tax=Favolaschia claudopus TaxID=2862362 RepID=A0AAV9ZBN6_9AGAR
MPICTLHFKLHYHPSLACHSISPYILHIPSIVRARQFQGIGNLRRLVCRCDTQDLPSWSSSHLPFLPASLRLASYPQRRLCPAVHAGFVVYLRRCVGWPLVMTASTSRDCEEPRLHLCTPGVMTKVTTLLLVLDPSFFSSSRKDCGREEVESGGGGRRKAGDGVRLRWRVPYLRLCGTRRSKSMWRRRICARPGRAGVNGEDGFGGAGRDDR